MGIAIWASMMNWFACGHVGLQFVHRHSRFELLRLIALLLTLPVFKASHFCFKRAYFLQHLKLTLVAQRCARLRGQNFSMQFPERIPVFEELASLHEFLDCLGRRLKGIRNGELVGMSYDGIKAKLLAMGCPDDIAEELAREKSR